jgi:hypothetical protein
LSWVVLRTRSDTAKDIEILVRRHQLAAHRLELTVGLTASSLV